jgi:NAD-dependent SIR2 family protein deacetylase
LLASFSKGVSPVSLFVGGSRSRHHHGSAIIRGGNCPFRSSSSANRRLFTLLLPPTLASRRYITTRTTTTANMGATEAKHDGGGDGKPDDEVPTETTEATSLEPTSNEANDAIDTLTSKLERLQVDEEEIPASLKKVAKWIESKKATRILVLSGAGVSCSAGIPDFRSPGTGLYDNLQKYNLPYPEAVFDLRFYRSNPAPFLNLAKELWPGINHSPTLTHSFISLLHQKNILLRNYSQNIDGLEYLAELPNEKLVECHGHFRTASCIECQTPSTDCEKVILTSNDVPKCLVCGGLVKPDIVFFGEGLPNKFHSLLPRDVGQADLLLVMGTSLQVAPVSMIPDMVDCKRVLLNRECVGNFHTGRDVVFEGDCDDAVYMLAKLLGWEKELLQLNEKTRIRRNKDDKNVSDHNEKEEEKREESLEELCGLGEVQKNDKS